MMQLFVSYAHRDLLLVESLVTYLRQAEIDVLHDADLAGDQLWWEKILGRIQSCDAVLTAVSRAAIASQACYSERKYAAQLGKPVLPIKLEPVPTELFPEDLARIQVIDYSQPDEAAAFRLVDAIIALPKARLLPNPLPVPPPVPQTRHGGSMPHREALCPLAQLKHG